ncbi:MAG: N-acetylmuramoyl-L-alanine amidase-like domain-containing protein [Bacteroidia bacterium]
MRRSRVLSSGLLLSILLLGETHHPIPQKTSIARDTLKRTGAIIVPTRIVGRTAQKVKEAFALHEGQPYSVWVGRLALNWQGIPYGSGGAGLQPHEVLLNLEQMDCMTAVENLMALHIAYQNGMPTLQGFSEALVNVRYDATPPCRLEDRLHYLSHSFMKWELAGWGTWLPLGVPDTRPIRYISANPKKYSGFTDWSRIRTIEEKLSHRPRYYIPSKEIQNWLPALKNGDLIAFVSPKDGLDVSHVGIFFWVGERATFAHASLLAKKWVFGEDLCAYLDRRGENVKGITVFRPH